MSHVAGENELLGSERLERLVQVGTGEAGAHRYQLCSRRQFTRC